MEEHVSSFVCLLQEVERQGGREGGEKLSDFQKLPVVGSIGA